RAHERLLGAVPGLLAIVQELIGEPPHALAISLDQRLERRRVAGETALDELPLIGARELRRAGRAGGSWRRHDQSGRPPQSSSCQFDGGTETLIHRVGRRAAARRDGPARSSGFDWRAASAASTPRR